jgi:hypothetical protein
MRSFALSMAFSLLAALTLSASVLAGDQRPMKGHYTIGVVDAGSHPSVARGHSDVRVRRHLPSYHCPVTTDEWSDRDERAWPRAGMDESGNGHACLWGFDH